MMTTKAHLIWGMYENRNGNLLSYHVEYIIQHLGCSKPKTMHHPTISLLEVCGPEHFQPWNVTSFGVDHILILHYNQ